MNITVRSFSLLCTFFLANTLAFGQLIRPVNWTFSVSSEKARVGDEAELIFKGTIKDTWYVYSSEFDCEEGPIKAEFHFTPNASYELIGKIQPIGTESKHDKIFDCDVVFFKHVTEFRQRIKILSPKLQVQGDFDYQACSEVSGQCVPGSEDFNFSNWEVTGAPMANPPAKDVKKDEKEVPPPAADSISAAVAPTESSVVATTDVKKIEGPIVGDFEYQDTAKNQSLWVFFIISFLSGLAGLLTPCVFPMIPMTVSFFTKKRGTKTQALFYGIFIILIYAAVGGLLAPLMGPEVANHLSTEWLPNLIFFAVFIIFGLSFLGLFEITLPGSFINRVDQKADKGGLGGVFFMAFTLVLVSFSCTGPIVGSILVYSASGEVIKPVVGMLGFSMAFALPFVLFALFPGWLKSLPKSGRWLNTVKVVLGFLEIGFAFKFLSIADQAFHWGILDREINIALWIAISVFIALYVMKAFTLPSDGASDDRSVSVSRIFISIVFITFAIYLTPGMWGAPLKGLAGYLPPMSTHDFDLASAGRGTQQSNTLCDKPKYADFLHFPHGIQGYFDYEQGLQCARQQDKPVFIDFTGHGCTNCREMEARVWSDPQVLQRLKNDFVVIALYVDDKTELPESQWYTSSYDNKIKKTIGKQNADLQIRRLKNNAQPFYVIVGKDEHLLAVPKPYDLSVENFVKFLDNAKAQYKTRNK